MMRRSATAGAPLALAIGLGVLVASGVAVQAQDLRTPTEVIEAFHAAISKNDSARAISLLAPDYAVYEFGQVDPNLAQYIQSAPMATWSLESRRMGGAGDEFWVLSTYRVTGADTKGTKIDDTVLETMIVERLNGQFRIAHFHWSATPAT